MSELTPEQKLIQEAIQKKVDYLKFFRRHVRWAGIVVQLVGIFTHTTVLTIVGTLVFLWSYMGTISIMEEINLLIWDRSEDESKTEPEEENQD